jgi:DNA-binding protein HU-beta
VTRERIRQIEAKALRKLRLTRGASLRPTVVDSNSKAVRIRPPAGMTNRILHSHSLRLDAAEMPAGPVVDLIRETITEALSSNDPIDLRGLGSFVVKEKKERQGRNLRTGETITIPAKRNFGFRHGKELSEGYPSRNSPQPESIALFSRNALDEPYRWAGQALFCVHHIEATQERAKPGIPAARARRAAERSRPRYAEYLSRRGPF